MDRRILLVDDEADVLHALKRMLRLRKFDVTTASGAEEALQILKESQIGVIVSDYRMPGMNGAELLSQVRRYWPDTIRLILSAHADLNTVMVSINSGATHKFLAKPWDNTELAAHLEEAVRKYDENLSARKSHEATSVASERSATSTGRNLDSIRLKDAMKENRVSICFVPLVGGSDVCQLGVSVALKDVDGTKILPSQLFGLAQDQNILELLETWAMANARIHLQMEDLEAELSWIFPSLARSQSDEEMLTASELKSFLSPQPCK